jgi:hypothetical protein
MTSPTDAPVPSRNTLQFSSALQRWLYRFGRGDTVSAAFVLSGLALISVSLLARLIHFLLQLPLTLIFVAALVAALGFLCLLISSLRLVSRMHPWWRRIFPALAFSTLYTTFIIVQFYPVLGISTPLYDALQQIANVLFQVGVVCGLLGLLTELVIRVRQRLLGTRPIPNS